MRKNYFIYTNGNVKYLDNGSYLPILQLTGSG